jgi:hypothetical protein
MVGSSGKLADALVWFPRLEQLEAVVSANLQRATRLRQSILQKAFTGQL